MIHPTPPPRILRSPSSDYSYDTPNYQRMPTPVFWNQYTQPPSHQTRTPSPRPPYPSSSVRPPRPSCPPILSSRLAPPSKLKARKYVIEAFRRIILHIDLVTLEEKGEGTPEEFTKALECYLKAVCRGHGHAHLSVGELFAQGKDVIKDEARAYEWYLKAAYQATSPIDRPLLPRLFWTTSKDLWSNQKTFHPWRMRVWSLKRNWRRGRGVRKRNWRDWRHYLGRNLKKRPRIYLWRRRRCLVRTLLMQQLRNRHTGNNPLTPRTMLMSRCCPLIPIRLMGICLGSVHIQCTAANQVPPNSTPATLNRRLRTPNTATQRLKPDWDSCTCGCLAASIARTPSSGTPKRLFKGMQRASVIWVTCF
ncbi:MAG: hypothetical protein J3R72DRAFT_222922 [Linnemannia gamsii]|nr:MAG: hypothetical protein J3R72DRAFT_222922 [Linnemannia gamsii]